MTKDYFTIAEAEAMLPRIITMLQETKKLKHEVEAIAASCNYDTKLLLPKKAEIQTITQKIKTFLDEFEDLNTYVKDLEIGIINFPSKFEGRDIMLCWKLGEQKIMYWHEIDETYAQREPIIIIEEEQ